MNKIFRISSFVLSFWGVNTLQAQLATSFYVYDSQGRLTSESLSNCTTIKYQYDNDGNRISTQKSQILITPTITDNQCYGSMQGSISLQSQGGSYNYQWSNNRSGTLISNLAAGNYTVTITDPTLNNTCIETYTISQPNPFNVSVTANIISCYGTSTGSASIDTSSFSSNGYRLTWPNGTHGISAENMTAGTFNLSVTDTATNCTQLIPFTITQTPSFISSVVTDSISCYGANDGFAAVTVSGNFSDYTFNWSTGNTSNSQNYLSPGPKIITVTDTVTGCVEQVVATIFEPTTINTTAQVQPSCIDTATGSVTLSSSGGIAPYKYAFNNTSQFQSINLYSPLNSGIYQVITRDSRFCMDTANVSVGSQVCTTGITGISDSLFVQVYPSPNNGEFFIEFSIGISTPYSIEITNNTGQLIRKILNTTSKNLEKMPVDLSNEPTGIYFIKLFSDNFTSLKSVEVIR